MASGRVKLAVLNLLHETYGIVEDDFTSASLPSSLPAVPEVGLDRSMIGAYGHDDRVCATQPRALLTMGDPCQDRCLRPGRIRKRSAPTV